MHFLSLCFYSTCCLVASFPDHLNSLLIRVLAGSCGMRVGEDLGEEELSLLWLIGVARSRSLGASCDWETGPLPESPRWDCPGH